MTRAGWLEEQLKNTVDADALTWLAHRRDDLIHRPESLGEVFPAVARKVGRGPLAAGWTVDEAARAVLLATLSGLLSADDFTIAVTAVYRYGDAGEKRGTLKALGVPEVAVALGNKAVSLLADAIRTNDQRLLAAALGPYATAHLDQPAFRQAVLKCVFAGVPLAVVDGLPERADDELTRMMTDFAAERTAAGRPVPPDIESYLSEGES